MRARALATLLLMAPAAWAQEAEGPSARGFIDTHMHLDGRYMTGPRPGPQNRRGPRGADRQPTLVTDYDAAAQRLIAMMDDWGVEQAVVMPPPQSPNQPGGYTYHELLSVVRRYPNRLVLAAGGGELSPLIFGTTSSAVTPDIQKEFTWKAEQILEDGAKAFGEMASLHYSFSRRHGYKYAPADHPLFLLLADLAAAHDVPIDLHMEAISEEEPTSTALLQRSPNNPDVSPATIPAFERLLAHNRRARIVWTHVGWDNTGHLTVELLRRLLAAHPNLYCAIKFVSREYEPFGKGNKLVEEPDMTLRHEWVQVLRDFPDRFMVGADEFIGIPDRTTPKGPPSFADTWSIIRQLPDDVRQQVGRLNAARVYRLN